MGVTMELIAMTGDRLSWLEADPERALDFIDRYCGHWRTGWTDWSPEDYLSLDKAWAPLSILLTGDVYGEEPWPEAGALFGGETFGGAEVSRKSPVTAIRLLSEQVVEVDAHLQARPFDALVAGLDDQGREEMADFDWDLDEEADAIREAYKSLAAFYTRAAARGLAMLKIGG